MLYNKEELRKELEKAVTYFSDQLKMLRTGRASAEMIGDVMVDAYGSMNKLNTIAQVLVDDAINVKVKVWDKGVIQAAEKALREANLGGSVAIESDFIRIKFNPLTEEDRKTKAKEVNALLEEGRVRIRQIRQDFMKKIEDLEGVSEDEQDRDKKDIQNTIDSQIKQLEEFAQKKQEELLKM